MRLTCVNSQQLHNKAHWFLWSHISSVIFKNKEEIFPQGLLELTQIYPQQDVRLTLKEPVSANVIERLSELSGPELGVHVPRKHIMRCLKNGQWAIKASCFLAFFFLPSTACCWLTDAKLNSTESQFLCVCSVTHFLVGHTGVWCSRLHLHKRQSSEKRRRDWDWSWRWARRRGSHGTKTEGGMLFRRKDNQQ